MEYFSQKNDKIIWINPTGNINHSIREIIFKILNRKKNFKVYNDKNSSDKSIENDNLNCRSIFIIPYHGYRLIRWINKKLVWFQIKAIEKEYFKSKIDILWTYYPSDIIIDLAAHLKIKNGCKIIYDNVQRLKGINDLPGYVLGFEEELYNIINLAFCDSITIYNDMLESKVNKILRVPQGVNIDDFTISDIERKSSTCLHVLDEFKAFKKTVVGYIGGIHHSFDVGLVEYIAENLKDIDFVFVGKVDIDIENLINYNNVHFWGYRDYTNLKYYIDNFDVCIIPYKVNNFTAGVYPTKMLEYIAMKKKIVSVELPDINDFKDIIKISKNKEKFLENIIDDTYNSISEEVIIKNSWNYRFKCIEDALGEI